MSEGQILLFRAGGLRLGVFFAEVARLLVEDALLAVPFAHPAMAGLLIADEDGPVPVFDLRGLMSSVERLGEPPPTTDAAGRPLPRTVALFPTARGPVGLRLEELLGTVTTYDALDTAAATALHADLPTTLQHTVTGAAKSADGRAFSFFSPDAFLGGLGL